MIRLDFCNDFALFIRPLANCYFPRDNVARCACLLCCCFSRCSCSCIDCLSLISLILFPYLGISWCSIADSPRYTHSMMNKQSVTKLLPSCIFNESLLIWNHFKFRRNREWDFFGLEILTWWILFYLFKRSENL